MRQKNHIDLLNISDLDEDVYSGAAGGDIDPNAVAGAAEGVAALAAVIAGRPKSQLQMDVKAVCGRKPLFNINGKKDKYFKCASQYAQQEREAKASPAPIVLRQPISKEKVLGMSKESGIAVGLLGIGLVIAGVVFTIKKMKQRGVVTTQPVVPK